MNKKTCVITVGPPGSGKSSFAKDLEKDGYVRVSQDAQGPEHFDVFDQAILAGQNIVVDRMNFNKEQRSRYLKIAKAAGYYTEIVVIHEPYETCYNRMLKRENHETIKDEKSRRAALHTFFTRYERVTDDEADRVGRCWPENYKNSFPEAVICDLDGTLCNIEHRLHFVRGEKKDWASFFRGIPGDVPNEWCVDVLRGLASKYQIVYCSGRGEDEREMTEAWLRKFNLDSFYNPETNQMEKVPLYMRKAKDSRKDSIVKEIILDFEILTRYRPKFTIDDRLQVVEMWRSRGLVCLQCAKGDF